MKKLLKALGILLLIIILLFAAVCVGLFLANKKMDFESDDVLQLAAAAPMPDSERYRFSADADTMTLSLDKRDIYWYLVNQYGDGFVAGIKEEFKEDDLEFKGFALDFEDGQAGLRAKVGYKFLTLNVLIPCELCYDDTEISLKPSGLKAFGLDFTDRLDESFYDFSIDVPYEHLMLDRIDSLQTGDGCLRFTGPMSVNFMGMAREGFTKEELENMLEDSRCSYAANILYKYTEDPAEGKHYWMSLLEKEPSLFKTIFEQLFSMISPQTFGGFHITEKNAGMIYRFIPSYDPLSYQENYKLLAADYK